MKSIVVITGYWPSETNSISGIFVVQHVSSLCRAGYKVNVVVGRSITKYNDRPLSLKDLGLARENINLYIFPVIRFPENISKFKFLFMLNIRLIGFSLSNVLRRVELENGAPIACIVHGLRYYVLSMSKKPIFEKVPIIAVVHGVDPFIWENLDLVKPYLKRALPQIDKVIIVGSPLSKYAMRIGIDPAKTFIVHNGTDVPNDENSHKRENSSDRIIKVVSVSNLVALKGIDDNLKALHFVKMRDGRLDWQYRIVGDGPERERLASLVDKLDLTSQVRFLGRLPYAQTMEEIAGADVFSLPSWGDAFGIVYLEAMARMKPTIGCVGSGAAEIITDGIDGILVPMHSADALSFALKRLFESQDLREKLGREAMKTAERFSWDANAKKILELCGLPHA